MYENITLLVSTSKAYEEMTPGFLKLFKKYCPFFDGPIKTNIPNAKYLNGIKPIKSNILSSRIIQAVKEIKTKYVLFFLEENYLFGSINESFFKDAYNLLEKNKYHGSAVLHDGIETSKKGNIDASRCFVECFLKAPFKITAQPTLWKKSFLLKVLRKDENNWQFETHASFRAHRYKKWKVFYPKNDYYLSAVPTPIGGLSANGKIGKEGEEMLRKENITIPIIDPSKNPPRKKHFLQKLYDHGCGTYLYIYLSVIFRHIKCKTDKTSIIVLKENREPGSAIFSWLDKN